LIRFQADADVDNDIVHAFRRREPAAEFVSAVEGGIVGLPDPDVLEIAAQQQRILVTHDRRTMPGHLRDRLDDGKSSPGVFIVSQSAPIGPVVEALVLVWAASDSREWRDNVHHIPSLLRHNFTR